MNKKISSAAVPALRLTAQDEKELRQLDQQLEQEILSQYEEFIFCDQRTIDTSKWEHVQSNGNIHAYKERHLKQRLYHRDPSSSSRSQSGPQQKIGEQSVLPRVLLAGTFPGTLEDVMYGLSFHDTPSLQGHWTRHLESMEESAVLATLDVPTLNDPYRFLGVIWFLRTFPLNILHHRDFLVFAFTRIAQLRNGERVGIFGGHSIEHHGMPEFHDLNTIRGSSSVLKIFRQFDENRVELFMIHFLDTRGSVPRRGHVQQSLGYLMPLAASLSIVGFRKKLEWLIAQRQHDAIKSQRSDTSGSCHLCEKKLGTLFSSSKARCHLCYQSTCSRCRTSHDLLVQMTVGKPTLKSHEICLYCSLQAKAMPTLRVAQQEVELRFSSSSTPSPALTSSAVSHFSVN